MDVLVTAIVLIVLLAIVRKMSRLRKAVQRVDSRVNSEVDRWFRRLEMLSGELRLLEEREQRGEDLEPAGAPIDETDPSAEQMSSLESEISSIEETILELRGNPDFLDHVLPSAEKQHLAWREEYESKHGPLPEDPAGPSDALDFRPGTET